MQLKYYKLHDDSHCPKQATSGSACFDISFYLKPNIKITGYSLSTANILDIHESTYENKNGFWLRKNFTYLMPTGIIFDIPKNHHLKLHERSSTCLKTNIELANKTGIIDNDYKEELFIPIRVRIASQYIIDESARFQIELCESINYKLVNTKKRPKRITTRKGGFGSTDKK